MAAEEEDGWHPITESRVTNITLEFKALLRQTAQTFSTMDQSTVVTDGHVNEAAKSIMRGNHKRSVLAAILRAILEVLGGGGVGAAIALYYDPNHNQTLVVFLLAAGIVMFVSAKVIEHLTNL